MKKFIIPAILFGMTALSSSSYAATIYTPTDHTINVSSGSGSFGVTRDTSGQFTDNFYFTTTSGEYGNVHVITGNAGGNAGQIGFSSIAVDGQDLTELFSGNPEVWGFSNLVWFNQGTHNIVIQGTSTGSTTASASYTGVVSLGNVAVPEPVSWMLMLSGLALTGGVVRKRRSRMSIAFN